jgi:hypothetical protein
MKDPRSYVSNGASTWVDFVDAGWPTTYAMTRVEYCEMVKRVLSSVSHCDVVLAELGGDLLGGGVPFALELCREWKMGMLCCANDAMGALAAHRLLSEHSIDPIVLTSIKQNPVAFSERLPGLRTIDPMNESDIETYLSSYDLN